MFLSNVVIVLPDSACDDYTLDHSIQCGILKYLHRGCAPLSFLGNGYTEFIFRNHPEPDKEGFFTDRHAHSTGTWER